MKSVPKIIWILVGVALILRIALLLAIVFSQGESALLVSDAPRFYKIAQALVAGHGFTLGDPPFAPSAFFPPVFLSLLAGSLALFQSVIPVALLHIILGSLLPLLVWKIAGFLTQDHRIRFLAVGLTAFEPQMILWSIVPTTEMIATFMMITALYFFLKIIKDFQWQDAAFSGFLLGLSTLTRPHAQFLFFLALIYLCGRVILRMVRGKGFPRDAIFTAIVFVLIFAATLSPWLIRNYRQFGQVSVSTTGLRNLYSDFATSVITLHSGKGFRDVRNELYENLAKKYGVGPQEVRENPIYGRELAKEGLKIIAANPKESAEVLLISSGAFFTQDLYTFYLRQFKVIPRFSFEFSPSVVLLKEGPFKLAGKVWSLLGAYAFIPILGRLFWVLLTFGWLYGAYRLIKEGGFGRTVALVFLLTILYYAATSAVGAFSDQGRLRYPVNSLIFILASYGAMKVLTRQWQKRQTNLLA